MLNTPAIGSHLHEEFKQKQTLLENQPVIIQRFIETQAGQIANALVQGHPRVHFTLPNQIVTQVPNITQIASISVPEKAREHRIGGILKKNLREEVRRCLGEMEQSPDQAIAASAGLLRHAVALHLFQNMLPAGRTVIYLPEDGDEIPSIPTETGLESAITQASDAIAEDGTTDNGRGELQVPYVPAARRFYLPQWVAFDQAGNLLVGSIKEAEAHIASMQKYLELLHMASSIASYVIASDDYQKKRYGMLGQLVNQGRSLAAYQTREIIKTIQDRAKAGTLNRGLSVSLPYFDDQALEMSTYRLEVIPGGRILFIPAFVVRATRAEKAKAAQDTRYNQSTRRHLLAQLTMLESAFQHEKA